MFCNSLIDGDIIDTLYSVVEPQQALT